MSNELVTITTNGKEVSLSPFDVRQYICDKATDKEIHVFLQLCKAQNLNPFLREIYLVKYGTAPATMVTGKETFLKRAAKNKKYAGHKAWTEGKVPDMVGKAEVYLEGYAVPISVEVDYDEYVGKKADGKPNAMWSSKPKTMLRKVALVQALREAFPDDLGGMYDSVEINTIAEELPETVITVKPSPVTEVYAEPHTEYAQEQEQESFPDPEPLPEQKPKERFSASPDKLITKAQLGYIHKLVDELGMDYEEARLYLSDKYKVTSSKELNSAQASEVIDFFKRTLDNVHKTDKDSADA